MASVITHIAYLDNNATTIMPANIIAEMNKWVNKGNPSASYESAVKCQQLMSEFRTFIAGAIGCPLKKYAIYFTSGATEANCMIVGGVIERARRQGGAFHIVVSAIEHKSILLMLQDLVVAIPEMSITYVQPTINGHIRAQDMVAAIRPSTKLVICMHANNEIGAINNIAEIARKVRQINPNIFFFSDMVQSFGKIPINLAAWQIDGASMSFHKLHGPPGVGAAIVSIAQLDKFPPRLYGTQNGGMRGGTENIIGIAAAFAASKMVFESRESTEKHEIALKKHLLEQIFKRAPLCALDVYMSTQAKMELQIVAIGEHASLLDAQKYLPHTLMLSAVKHIGPSACNQLIKDKLEKARIIVSVGSACNTKITDHSHVLRAMNIPDVVMDGAIRVSMCAFTTIEEIDRFVDAFLLEVNRQYQTAKK